MKKKLECFLDNLVRLKQLPLCRSMIKSLLIVKRYLLWS